MGTRSITIIQDIEYSSIPLSAQRRRVESEIVVMYRQYDGYPEGHGKDLVDFLAPFKLVNGYSPDNDPHTANGMGCLAAQIVAYFKNGVGEFYLFKAGTRNVGEEYRYTVYPNEQNEICVRCEAVYDNVVVLWDRSVRELVKTIDWSVVP